MVRRALSAVADGGTALLVFDSPGHAVMVRREHELPPEVMVACSRDNVRGCRFSYVEVDHYAQERIVEDALRKLCAFDDLKQVAP